MYFGDDGSKSILQSLITGMHIRSNFGPDMDILDPFAPSPAPNPVLSALQPEIVFDTNVGTPLVIAPYGTPGPTSWSGLLALGGGVTASIVALAGYGAWRLLRG